MNIEQVIELNKDNDVYFFGAGGVFTSAVKRHKEFWEKAKIKGVFDNSEVKWGQNIEGYTVLPLEKMM